MSREVCLRNLLRPVQADYDYILIDCMPSLGMMTINALTVADKVMIPVQAEFLATKGMTRLLQTIGNVRRHTNPKLEIDGILITLADNRKPALTSEISNMIRKTSESIYGYMTSQFRMEAAASRQAVLEKVFMHLKRKARLQMLTEN